MALTKEEEALYRKTMEHAKKKLDEIDSEMEKELQKVRAKLLELKEAKKSAWSVYEGLAMLLGIEIEEQDKKTDISKSLSVENPDK
ncbi:MAG: hypothetical protein IBX60_05260 [Candidatus Aminicenantes bacterium]|nr:hypothetical protein [Candidatus Aminicenantes bacterium]